MNPVSRSMTMWLLTVMAPANVHAAPAADAEPPPVIAVVVHNYAGIAPLILEQATETVARAYHGLGIDLRWVGPARQPGTTAAGDLDKQLIATVHLRVFVRQEKDPAGRAVLGIDAPMTTRDAMKVAHVLYQGVGDGSTSALVLAHVMAHLIAGMTVAPDGTHRATIVRADRIEARRLARGGSPFTDEEAMGISGAIVLFRAREHDPINP